MLVIKWCAGCITWTAIILFIVLLGALGYLAYDESAKRLYINSLLITRQFVVDTQPTGAGGDPAKTASEDPKTDQTAQYL